jgi:hypothetical protein
MVLPKLNQALSIVLPGNFDLAFDTPRCFALSKHRRKSMNFQGRLKRRHPEEG